MNPQPDWGRIRDNDHWRDRYGRWIDHCQRPTPIVITRPIRWEQPVPDYSQMWSYTDLETVAIDLEGLTRTIYDVMAQVTPSNPNRAYAMRLMGVLADLEVASEGYTDALYNGTDYIDSLNELFYLDAELTLTEQTLDGYSKSYMVDQEMRSMRFYVNELLWQYRQNY